MRQKSKQPFRVCKYVMLGLPVQTLTKKREKPNLRPRYPQKTQVTNKIWIFIKNKHRTWYNDIQNVSFELRAMITASRSTLLSAF